MESEAQDHVLLVEDSASSAKLGRQILEDLYPGIPIVVVTNWMDAVKHIAGSVLIVIDWVLDDGVTAQDAGALDLLKDLDIPHFIWTGTAVTKDKVGCPVVKKKNGEELIHAVMALKSLTVDE